MSKTALPIHRSHCPPRATERHVPSSSRSVTVTELDSTRIPKQETLRQKRMLFGQRHGKRSRARHGTNEDGCRQKDRIDPAGKGHVPISLGVWGLGSYSQHGAKPVRGRSGNSPGGRMIRSDGQGRHCCHAGPQPNAMGFSRPQGRGLALGTCPAVFAGKNLEFGRRRNANECKILRRIGLWGPCGR